MGSQEPSDDHPAGQRKVPAATKMKMSLGNDGKYANPQARDLFVLWAHCSCRVCRGLYCF
jgi:hypothetical protein